MPKPKPMRLILIFIVLNVTCSYASANNDGIQFISDFSFLVDTTGQLQVHQVAQLHANGETNKRHSKSINLKIRDSVVWFAIDVVLNPKEIQYLSIGNESNVWKANLYAKDSTSQYVEFFTYNHLKKPNDSNILSFNTMVAPLPIDRSEILIRISALQNRNYILRTGNLHTISSHLIFTESIPVAFIGFMICIFIYNTFLFVSSRVKVFIPYLVYLLFTAFAIPFHSGYVLYSTAEMWQGGVLYNVWMSMLYLSSGIFAIMYLNLRETAPGFRWWIIGLMFMMAVMAPIAEIFNLVEIDVMSFVVSTTSLVFNLSLWTSGVYVWINGFRQARFYVLGWLFVITGLIVFILSSNNLIPYGHQVDYCLYVGFAMEAVLFAFALGDQLNVLRREKHVLEVKHIEIITEKNRLLAKQLFMNSHLLRAPLSRILGLLGLLRKNLSKEEADEMLDHVEHSTLEMDDMTRKMSNILEKEGYLDQYQDDFEKVKSNIYQDLTKRG